MEKEWRKQLGLSFLHSMTNGQCCRLLASSVPLLWLTLSGNLDIKLHHRRNEKKNGHKRECFARAQFYLLLVALNKTILLSISLLRRDKEYEANRTTNMIIIRKRTIIMKWNETKEELSFTFSIIIFYFSLFI